jgi:hypothetical protein
MGTDSVYYKFIRYKLKDSKPPPLCVIDDLQTNVSHLLCSYICSVSL